MMLAYASEYQESLLVVARARIPFVLLLIENRCL
jgi:hypothetical protein